MPYLMTELVGCLEILYEILEDLEDIRIALRERTRHRLLSFPQPWLRSFQNYWKILLIFTCYVFHHPL
jgi:hypothetical protein